MKVPLFLACVVVFIGCAPKRHLVPAIPTVIRSYTVGEERRAGIGDPIFDVQSARKVPEFVALRAHDPGRVRGLPGVRPIEAGDRLRAVWRLQSGNYVIRHRADTSAAAIVVMPDGQALGFYDGREGYGAGKWPAEVLFTTSESLEGQEGAYRAQMIYSGLDGNTARATYREFSGDFIRPAFSQELQYNLTQDSTIAYKTIKIRVLEASNSQIRYRISEDGGLPWLPGGATVPRETSAP
jgi:hypothetical protein